MCASLSVRVSGFEGDEHVTGVVLSDGTVLPADVVVESVGSVANTEWLDGNGLDLTDGVLTDGQLRVGGLPYVVAVGDVARFPNARYDGVPRRVEHWSIPGDTAKHAAKARGLISRVRKPACRRSRRCPPSGATSTTSGCSPSVPPYSASPTSASWPAIRAAT